MHYSIFSNISSKTTIYYEVRVGNEITDIHIDAEPSDEKATLTGTGDYTLNTGTNEANANRNTDETITTDKLDSLDEYKKFREYANNVYEDIFKECNSLFFGLI